MELLEFPVTSICICSGEERRLLLCFGLPGFTGAVGRVTVTG